MFLREGGIFLTRALAQCSGDPDSVGVHLSALPHFQGDSRCQNSGGTGDDFRGVNSRVPASAA